MQKSKEVINVQIDGFSQSEPTWKAPPVSGKDPDSLLELPGLPPPKGITPRRGLIFKDFLDGPYFNKYFYQNNFHLV